LSHLSVSALVLFIKFVILVTNKIIKNDKIKGHNFYSKEFPQMIRMTKLKHMDNCYYSHFLIEVLSKRVE